MNGELPNYNMIRPFLCKGVDRRSVLDSVGFLKLVDAIHSTNGPVIVAVSSMNRLGTAFSEIKAAMDSLTRQRDDVTLVVLDSYGLDSEEYALDLSDFYTSDSKRCCSHVNPERGIMISVPIKNLRKKYSDYAAILKKEFISSGSLPPGIQEAAGLGKILPSRLFTIRAMLRLAVTKVRNREVAVEDIAERIVENYPFKSKDIQPSQVGIYTRTSPRCSSLCVSDLPVDQLSICTSYYTLNEDISKDMDLIIINDERKKSINNSYLIQRQFLILFLLLVFSLLQRL